MTNNLEKNKLLIENIPAIIWGDKSDRVYIFVHGKMSSKEAAESFARIANDKGYQTISFDLAEHGERSGKNERCDIWTGIKDLNIVADYVFAQWNKVSLFGCSLGAYFSLNAYTDRRLEKCLFQSPVVNMKYLIEQMMIWFDVSQERLEAEGEVETPIDIMSWKYYQYVLEHPTSKWNFSTSVLYGGKDNLQSREVITDFCNRFDIELTISENSEHPFMEEKDTQIVEEWMEKEI